VALAFDEALGMATNAAGHVSVTGRLTIRYRRLTPLHTEVTLEAHTARVEGRRITTVGTMRVGDAITAEAHGLFITADP
jgi:acyl-CoA thioesterase FadM